MRLILLKSYIIKILDLINFLKNTVPTKFIYFILQKNLVNAYIESFNLQFVTKFLKCNPLISITNLVDIAVIDLLENSKRFKLVYNFLSHKFYFRVLLNFFVEELQFVCSLKNVFKSSPWLEREVWDMFGIFFINNNDMRRILTDYGFRGFPFRKDFPLTGYIELRHDDSRGDIVYEPLELTQELRFFNFATGWEKDY